jgi:hypothetical protein
MPCGAKAPCLSVSYPPHKWDGNEFLFSLPLVLTNGILDMPNKALAKPSNQTHRPY